MGLAQRVWLSHVHSLMIFRFLGRTPLFCRMNMIRFSATRSGISTVLTMRRVASS